MNYDIIDRCTYAGRKRLSIRIWEILKRRNRSIITDKLLSNFVELKSSDTRLNKLI